MYGATMHCHGDDHGDDHDVACQCDASTPTFEGEALCEGHGYDEAQCANVGCCEWAGGPCHYMPAADVSFNTCYNAANEYTHGDHTATCHDDPMMWQISPDGCGMFTPGTGDMLCHMMAAEVFGGGMASTLDYRIDELCPVTCGACHPEPVADMTDPFPPLAYFDHVDTGMGFAPVLWGYQGWHTHRYSGWNDHQTHHDWTTTDQQEHDANFGELHSYTYYYGPAGGYNRASDHLQQVEHLVEPGQEHEPGSLPWHGAPFYFSGANADGTGQYTWGDAYGDEMGPPAM